MWGLKNETQKKNQSETQNNTKECVANVGNNFIEGGGGRGADISNFGNEWSL